MLAGSVAGFVAIGLSVSLILLLGLLRLLRRGRLLLILSVLVVFSGGWVITAYFVASVSLDGKMSELTFSDNFERVQNTTGQGRLDLLEESWSLIQNNPLFGYGMDRIKGQDSTTATTAVVHNALALGWLAGGLLTFAGLILIYWLTLRMIFRASLAIFKGHGGWLALGLAGSSLGWIVISMNNPVIYSRYSWISVSLLLGLAESKSAYPESTFSYLSQAIKHKPLPTAAFSRISVARHH
jgi:hypothetical protein